MGEGEGGGGGGREREERGDSLRRVVACLDSNGHVTSCDSLLPLNQ